LVKSVFKDFALRLKMKILVLGSDGLVGKNLRDLVNNDTENEWVFATRLDADLTIFKEVENLFEKVKPTHVINLAAYVGGLYKNMSNGVEFFEKNILINMNVMKASIRVKKLLSLMSTCIFPDKIDYPITEEKLHLGPPHTSNEGYSYAKRMIDVLSRTYNKQYGTNYITVIPGNLYGPYDNFNLEDAHVIPALMHKMKNAKLYGEPLIIFGTGKALRQFTHASDLATYLVWMLNNYEDKEPLIVSSEEEYSIFDLVQILKEEFEYDGEIIWDNSRSDGQIKKTISCEKLKKIYPNPVFCNLKDGLKGTIKWFINSQNYRK
jgi:GDP-L-fucose synthase